MIKYRFLKFINTDVACHRRRFLSTAVARDLPNACKKTGKKVPKAVRKAMVDDYVNKYRAINAGKFPNVGNTRTQVGGSWYTIRAILQELEHNSKLSAVTADNNSVVGSASQRNDVHSVKETVNSVTPLDKIAEPEDYGDLSENSIHCLEKTAPDRILMKSEMDNFKLHEKSNLPSEGPGLSSTMSVEIDKASAQASEFTMFTVPDPENTKKQDDGSMLPAVKIINEADQISEVREVLNCQLTMDRTPVTDNGGVSAETGSTSQGEVETNRCQMKLDMTSMTKINSTTEGVSGSDTIIDLEYEKTSTAGLDKVKVRRVLDKTNLVERSSADETVKASESENSQICANPSYPSDAVNESVDTGFGDAKESSPSSISDGYSRFTVPDPENTKKQDDGSMLPAVEIINEAKERQTAKAGQVSQEQEGTLWGNMKSMARKFINIWRT